MRNKTDEVDSRSLGLYGRERAPQPYQPALPEYQELRALERQRQVLLQQLAAERMRLQENSPPKSVGAVLKSHVLYLEKLLQRVEKAMHRVIRSSARLEQDIQLLMSIPGVGVTTATAVLAELGDLRQFRRSRQITAMAGLTPRNHRSGMSKKPTRVDRVGNPGVRKALNMPALTISRMTNTTPGRQYHTWVQKDLKSRQALAAVMRKLLVLMRAILLHETPYQEDYAS